MPRSRRRPQPVPDAHGRHDGDLGRGRDGARDGHDGDGHHDAHVEPWLQRWADDRLGTSRFARETLNKVFPDHWSFLLGEVALYCFTVLVGTGIFLTLFFSPSPEKVTYHGSYVPLRGVEMSAAYESTVRLSFDIRAGLLVRQVHHWAALLFLAAILMHLARIFFTGAFRRPREINWLIGLTMMLLAMLNGFTGYSLPDDLLSGTGLRVAYSVLLSIPFVGTWLAFGLFGGEFPDPQLLGRLYIIHVLLVPAAIGILLGAHLAIVWRQKHTQFPGPGRTEGNVVGTKLWPTYAARSIALALAVFAALAALGGLVQINPVWVYGPFEPAAVSTASQPDWYVGWLEGALRLAPPWRLHVFGWTVSEVFVPAVVLPGLTFLVLYLWPWIERKVSGDRAEHQLLDRPRDHPVRTAIGTAAFTFYAVLLVAGGQDVIAQRAEIDVGVLTQVLRVLLVVLPLLVAAITWKLCRDLVHDDRERRELGLPTSSGTTPAPGEPLVPTAADG